jgi:D-alanyl-D-alanine carboxypeptidase
MVSSADCWAKYGNPFKERHMIVWVVPNYLHIGPVPRKIYCNKDLVPTLTLALENVLKAGISDQIKTWDGCFNIRSKRASKSMSLHSWGIAIDINAAWNRFGKKPTMSPELVKCFTDAGFDWGGVWGKPDGMHFQLKKI